jgi:hypothetical protein
MTDEKMQQLKELMEGIKTMRIGKKLSDYETMVCGYQTAALAIESERIELLQTQNEIQMEILKALRAIGSEK